MQAESLIYKPAAESNFKKQAPNLILNSLT